jgi:hypothetical protein
MRLKPGSNASLRGDSEVAGLLFTNARPGGFKLTHPPPSIGTLGRLNVLFAGLLVESAVLESKRSRTECGRIRCGSIDRWGEKSMMNVDGW